jgi:hypothetical protein
MIPWKNLSQGERVARLVVGGVLVVVGFLVSGYWRPLAIIVGAGLAVSGLAGS